MLPIVTAIALVILDPLTRKITYDDQELVQLVYDTRKEAQARVDEINNEDRLDRLGVEGKQNKRVGIREVKRANTDSRSSNRPSSCQTES